MRLSINMCVLNLFKAYWPKMVLGLEKNGKYLLKFSFIVILYPTAVYPEVNFSGFLSVGAGQVISNNSGDNTDTFITDYSNAGIYEKDTTYEADTSVGIQIDSDLLENIIMRTQLIGYGSEDFNAKIDWLYLTYEFQPDIFFDIGRKRLPLYYYSEFFDVGYAYVWVRPPVDNYTWQINHYNGITLRKNSYFDGANINLTLYYGREDSENNLILGQLLSSNVDETWRDLIGAVISFSKHWIDVRLNILNGRNDRVFYGYFLNNNSIIESNDTVNSFDNLEFTNYGVAVNLDNEKVFVLTEYNIRNREQDPQIHTYLVSLGYKWNVFSWHLTYSEFKQKSFNSGLDGENHNTRSTGIRWDFHSQASVKLQYDRFHDQGGSQYNLGGDSETVSMAFDMIF